MKKLLFSGLFLLVCVMTAQAQSQAIRELIAQQLLQAGIIFTAAGYELTHEIEYSSLNDGYSDTYTVNLQGGVEYKITAACDGDCGDIDLKLYDENGNLIDSDVETDDRPIVGVTPRWSGRFKLWVRMYDCTANPCYFGIGIFGK